MEVIYGLNPIKEALIAKSREFFDILVGRERYDEIANLAHGIPLHTVSKKEIDKISRTEAHQGVAARVSGYRYVPLEQLFPLKIVLVLDSIEDPQNLGAIVRSAHTLAGAGVVIPNKNAASITPSAVKASAGATEHTKIARVPNLRSAAQVLKKNGFWLIGMEAGQGEPLSKAPSFEKIAIVVGGEDAGIRCVLQDEIDVIVHIPMKSAFNSLNVAQSASIAIYELATRRQG
jgi:23S rRNA (guanosine2251-2'-O)-methyltransferase